MADLVLAAIIFVGLVVAYGWGYRSGVASCERQLRPLLAAVKELRDMAARRT
jgi:hypothetical protein